MTAAPRRLRCENQVDPIGIDELTPRLAWEVDDDRRGARQTAYEIEVTSVNGVVWQSGRVESGVTSHVVYAGAPLGSRDRCQWRVRSWDADGVASPWSAPASFEIGLVAPAIIGRPSDWRAGVIRSSLRGTRKIGAPAPYMRRTFTVDGAIESARLYVTAFGLYEAYVNGVKVSADAYRPGWTDYRIRLPYQTYDVTNLLRQGANVLGALLGDGWYCGSNNVAGPGRQVYGERPGLIAQLEVKLVGESSPMQVCTDKHWRTTASPILENDNYHGETYDARLELSNWSEPGFDDTAWDEVEVSAPSLAALVATVAPPVRAVEELSPIAVWESAPGTFVFDLGQNMVGHVRLRVAGHEGTQIVLRHAEALNQDRSIWLGSVGKARATDTYTCKGSAEEGWEPRFTFHGFRYVEVGGYPGTPEASAITGIVTHSDLERTGTFECSHPLVNRLYQNIVWSQRGNSVDVPTDCPQRTERLGWTGDVVSFVRTAVFNYDMSAFLTKWITDLLDGQLVGGVEDGQFPFVAPRGPQWGGGGPAWSDAAIVVPWTLYQAYGDTRLLERVYPALLRWMCFLDREAAGRTPGAFGGFGDWVSLDFVPAKPLGFDERWGGTSLELLRSAFHVNAARLLARIAAVLGRDDADHWNKRFDELRTGFAAAFLSTGRFENPTQTACALALQLDILPASLRAEVEADLVADVEKRGHLVTGFVGTPFLLPALTEAGRVDLAYRLLERQELPSWLFQVAQGATTIWERWDAWTPEAGYHPDDMNSLNHYAQGAVGSWLHATIGGIDVDPEGPGFSRLRIAPRPGGTITSARASLHTPHGRARCAWVLDPATLRVDVTVPANATASVRLATGELDSVRESGTQLATAVGVSDLRQHEGVWWCTVSAGSYSFTISDPVLN